MTVATDYWEERYATGGNSGRGSRGQPAHLKAGFVNRAVEKHGVVSILDLGCGDGFVSRLIKCGDYYGYDRSLAAVILASKRAPQHKFGVSLVEPRDAHLSLDVIRHLVDDDEYSHYMGHLFAAERVVMVWSSNRERPWSHYERERRWTPDVPAGWRLTERSGKGIVGSRFYLYLKETP